MNNSDITDFIANPNWYNRDRNGIFKTLNSTDINTDGVAAKISYISPQFYNSYLGFTYVPDSWNNAGLINRRAEYKNKSGYISVPITKANSPALISRLLSAMPVMKILTGNIPPVSALIAAIGRWAVLSAALSPAARIMLSA